MDKVRNFRRKRTTKLFSALILRKRLTLETSATLRTFYGGDMIVWHLIFTSQAICTSVSSEKHFFPDESRFLSLWKDWKFQSTKRKFVSNLNECYTQADRKVCELIITNWLRCFHVGSCSSMGYVYSHEITDWIGDIAARRYISTEKTL